MPSLRSYSHWVSSIFVGPITGMWSSAYASWAMPLRRCCFLCDDIGLTLLERTRTSDKEDVESDLTKARSMVGDPLIPIIDAPELDLCLTLTMNSLYLWWPLTEKVVWVSSFTWLNLIIGFNGLLLKTSWKLWVFLII